MSHFYGKLQGSARSEATRCGTKDSGLTAWVASWRGAVRSEVYLRESDGVDCVRVSVEPWEGVGQTRELFDGPINTEDDEVSKWTLKRR